MKKVLSLLILSLAFIACSDDDDNAGDTTVELENQLKIGNSEYDLKSGVIQKSAEPNEGLNSFGLILFSSNITVIDGDPIPEDNIITGVALEIYSDNSETFEVADYDYTEFEQASHNTFQVQNLLIEINVEEQDGETREVNIGSLEVKEVGDIYELEFSGTDEEGNNVVFHYRGALEVIEVL